MPVEIVFVYKAISWQNVYMLKAMVLTNILGGFTYTQNVTRETTQAPRLDYKPFLQWVGGKRQLLEQYESLLPKSFDRYFEPFVGGGAMFFHLTPEDSVIADNNLELIKTYEGVRDHVDEVIHLLNQFRSKHSKELYMAIRGIDREVNILEDLKNYEIAARFIYLNQTCFNGVYRVNQKGQFNVPIGSSLNRLICDAPTLIKASEILKKAKILCCDFSKALQNARKHDFIYLDPPYYPVNVTSDFTRYTKEKFYENDHVRLKEMIDELTDRGCKVMLSNSDTPLVRKLYSNYSIHTVYAGRTLNSDPDKRGKVAELLITNY